MSLNSAEDRGDQTGSKGTGAAVRDRLLNEGSVNTPRKKDGGSTSRQEPTPRWHMETSLTGPVVMTILIDKAGPKPEPHGFRSSP